MSTISEKQQQINLLQQEINKAQEVKRQERQLNDKERFELLSSKTNNKANAIKIIKKIGFCLYETIEVGKLYGFDRFYDIINDIFDALYKKDGLEYIVPEEGSDRYFYVEYLILKTNIIKDIIDEALCNIEKLID